MAFKWDAEGTQWFADQDNKMMLQKNHNWNPDGENGKGDAIGRSFIAYYTYGDERFLEGIENCWERVERKGWLKRLLFGKYYYQGKRYPVPYKGQIGLSRDHLTYTILAYKYAGYSEEFIKDFVRHLRWRISDFARFTPDLWLWTRAIANIKPYKSIYFPIQWITLKITAWWNRMLYKWTGFGEESHQDDFIKVQNNFKPKGVRRWAKMFYPIYALQIQAWQIRLLDDCKWKKRLQKVALELCPKYNYAIQLLLESPNPPSEEDVLGYKSMKGGRWGGILNTWINDRDMKINKEPELLTYNVMDVDYVRKLFYTIPCIPMKS